MVIVFALFFGLMLSVILSGHYFIYFSLVKFFAPVGPAVKTMLVVGMVVLAVSFVTSSLLSHWFENLFTRLYYYFAGIWLGFALNVLIVFLLVWLVVLIARLIGAPMNVRFIGTIAVSLAIVMTVYGAWNARQLQVREISLKLDNLPPAWRGKTVVQLTDLHLGIIYGPGFMAKVVDRINDLKPEAVFLTGDYFDGMEARLDELAAPLKNLTAPQGTYFITGNHEVYLGVDKARVALEPTGVKFLSDAKVDLNGLAVVGVDWPELGGRKDIVSLVTQLAPKRPSILLYHEPRYVEEIAKTGLVDLMLSGHTHKGQVWPINYVAKLVYGKYYIGLHQLGDFNIYTSPGAGTWGPSLRIGNRPEIVAITFE